MEMGKRAPPHLLCAALLVVFLVVSAMHVVPAEAGRALIDFNPLHPDGPAFPGVGPDQPYTTRPCRYKYRCPPHDAP